MSSTATSPKMPRFSNKQAQQLVHSLWKDNADEMYLKRDMKYRIIGVVCVLTTLMFFWLGKQQGLLWVQITSLLAGVGVFGGTLWVASRNSKADYNRFVIEHLADDGTFLFCPSCRQPLGDTADDQTRANPPDACQACGGKPWKPERSA